MPQSIRPAGGGDAEAVRAIYAPYVSDSATSFETTVPEGTEVERRIETGRDRYPWLVFEKDQTVLGYAYASAHRARTAYQWSVEVSVYVHPQAHRRGIGRALYTALLDLLRRQHYVNAYAGITLPNPASLALHRSLGFEPIGVYRGIGFKFDRWHDVAWLHLRLGDDTRRPLEPGPTVTLWSDAAVGAMLAQCADAVRFD
jgi:L-amino acid N-acyltransferase YncA